MEKQLWARFCTLSLFSGGLGALIATSDLHKHAVGRTEYLQQQAELFDKSTVSAHPVGLALGCMILIALSLGLYELIAFVMLKVFFRSKS